MGDVATAKPMTASQQLRKVRKPLIERKRRERINGCLNELKSLVLDALNKDEAQFSKLEKADILELALEVLKKKKAAPAPQTPAPEPSVIASKYTAGFSQCALEVARCLGTIQGVKPEIRVHLTEHLAGCVQKLAKVANAVGATGPAAPQNGVNHHIQQRVGSPDQGYQGLNHQNGGSISTRDRSPMTSPAAMPSPAASYTCSISPSSSQSSPDSGYSTISSPATITIPMASSIPVYSVQQVEVVSPPQHQHQPQVGVVYPMQQSVSPQFSSSFEKDSCHGQQTGFFCGYSQQKVVHPVALLPAQVESRNVWRPWNC